MKMMTMLEHKVLKSNSCAWVGNFFCVTATEEPSAAALFGDADDISSEEDEAEKEASDGEQEARRSEEERDRRSDEEDVPRGEDVSLSSVLFNKTLTTGAFSFVQEEEKEREPEPLPETRIDVEVPKITCDLGRDIHFVKLPNFLSVETRPFDQETYEDEIDEEETLDEEGRAR